jgi:hypothetical protein
MVGCSPESDIAGLVLMGQRMDCLGAAGLAALPVEASRLLKSEQGTVLVGMVCIPAAHGLTGLSDRQACCRSRGEDEACRDGEITEMFVDWLE